MFRVVSGIGDTSFNGEDSFIISPANIRNYEGWPTLPMNIPSYLKPWGLKDLM